MRLRDFSDTWGYALGCITLAILVGTVSIRALYLGATTGADVYFQIFQAYGGIALIFLSFAFIEFNVKRRPRKFVTFETLFIVGIGSVTPFIQSGMPFDALTCFEVGSFALLATGFFITRDEEAYHNVLLLSITATFVLFLSGLLAAFRAVPGASASTIGINSITIYLNTALFLAGAVDLTFASALLFVIVIQKVRRVPQDQEPVGPYIPIGPPLPDPSPYQSTKP